MSWKAFSKIIISLKDISNGNLFPSDNHEMSFQDAVDVIMIIDYIPRL